VFFSKLLKSLDKFAEPDLHDFDAAIKRNKLAISSKKAAEGAWHSVAHFDELKTALFQETIKASNNIVALIKANLESHGSGYKIKVRHIQRKIDHYINILTEQARTIIIQENVTSPTLRQNQLEQLIADFDSSCNNLRHKLHNEISIFTNAIKLKNKKDPWLFKAVKYVCTFFGGMVSKIIADHSGALVMYAKKGILLIGALIPHLFHIFHKLHIPHF